MADEAFLSAVESLHADAQGLVRAVQEEQRTLSRAQDQAEAGWDTTGEVARGLDRQGEHLGAAAASGRESYAAAALALTRWPESDGGLRRYDAAWSAVPLPGSAAVPDLPPAPEVPAPVPGCSESGTPDFGGLWERLEAEMATLDEAVTQGLTAAQTAADELDAMLSPSPASAGESRAQSRARAPLQP